MLAGRRNRGRLQGVSDAAWEALVPIAGRPMVGYVLAALGGVDEIDRIAVVGPDPGPTPPGRGPGTWTVVPPGDSLVENLRRGVDSLGACDEILVVTSDVPLLGPEDVTEFLRRCREREADLGYPIVERRDCEAAFPGVRRTYVRLSDGAYTGGNVIYLRGDALERVWPFLDRVYAARKRPYALLPLFGFGVAVAVLTGRARVAALERRVERLAGLRARAVAMKRPAIAVDVDKPEDLELAARMIALGWPEMAAERR